MDARSGLFISRILSAYLPNRKFAETLQIGNFGAFLKGIVDMV